MIIFPKLRICFTGVDGSGKTTHAKLLQKELNKINLDVKYQHLFPDQNHDEQGLVNKTIEKIGQWTQKPTNNIVIDILKIMLRIFGIAANAWIKYVKDEIKYPNSIKIYDRYSYDNLVLYAKSFFKYHKMILIMAKIIPRPDIVILMKIKPLTSIKRKGGNTLKDVKVVTSLYEKLKKIVSAHVVNTEHLNKKGSQQVIYQLVSEELR
jgi:thymidylate kinase